MSVRRRNIQARLERERAMAAGRAETDASLARMKRVLDEAIAEGLTQLSQEEFWRRYHAIGELPPDSPGTSHNQS